MATDGGRYDVNILRRQRIPVYWKGAPTEVRRCSWFYKGNSDGKYVPYEENIATKLEEEFKSAFEQTHWHRKVELPNGETVVFHAPDVLVLFPPSQSPDAWGNTPVSTLICVEAKFHEISRTSCVHESSNAAWTNSTSTRVNRRKLTIFCF